MPPLAWLITFAGPKPTLLCGRDVEVFDGGFFEGCWAGEFERRDFDTAGQVFGSGGRIAGDRALFVTPSHTVDAVYALRRGGTFAVAVKRKMSGFPTKARAAPAPSQVFRYAEHIRVIAPAGSPADPAPSPTATAKKRPTRRRPRKAAAPPGRPSWLEHVRAWRASGLARATYGERRGLNPRAFHQWVARSRQTFRKGGSPP